jgi:hypothetical protein
MTGRGVSRLGALTAATALLSACIAPAFDSGAFERNAIHALDSAVSDTRTAALALEQDLSDRLVRPYADTVVTQSEDDIGPVQDSFGSVDPPTKADEKLRDHVGGLLSDAGDALAAARIALRNDDRAGMARSVRNLRSVAAEMERTSERLS